ncbi:[protein-PII] uridylyltransferase [Caulobacter sp. KR2-114]|uniref:[protein-PII] uridylyltransferase n=1 Tax=Caulobacter sp. KR2-114 TaxID=3400912 RepID=UPI003C024C86
MPPRLRPTRLEHVVDGHRLRAQLSTAALDAIGDEPEQRRRAIEILKGALFRGRMIAKERLENGAGGVETARLLCGVTDEVISALYDFTTVHVFRARNPTEGERLALMAVGGYGRGALAPFSDIDLLFVRPYKQTAHAESVIEYMLYALWDLGFKVGHASRTIDECVKLSREDITIRTSILEARRLTGDEALAAMLKRRYREEVVKGTGAEFVAAKLKERDERHARAGASRFMVEPNVKEGKGGLRDLHTLFWIAQYLHPADGVEAVMRMDMFQGHEVRAFIRAFDFLESVRAHLHFATGRAEERLTFDLQPEVARRMGYNDRPRPGGDNTPAVERFMRRYFLIAKEVGTLTRAFSAKLEAEHLKSAPRGLSRFLPGQKPARPITKPIDVPGFHIEGQRLTVDSPEVFDADPVNLIRLFKVADQRDLDLHPDAFTAVTRKLGLITSKVRRDPEAIKAFLDILARGRNTRRILDLMNEAGVLGRFLPEFGRIVAQMQFNMYHSYTVDEHTLRAVGIIADIAAGRYAEDHPLATATMPLIKDRESLFLAMLLHDTGKGGVGGQEKAGARSARQACERMGLDRHKIELVAWLVEHHLVMSDFAQKRDVADPATIAAFARIVEDPERLRLLLVLTVADIRAVGPGIWNGWKGQLLRELYGATETIFRGGRISDAAGIARRRQEAIAYDARTALVAQDPEARAWATGMEDAYFVGFTLAEQRAHRALASRAQAQGGAAAEARIRADRNAAEIVVAAADRQGLFADLALTIAALGGNVVGARIFTSSEGQALDVFYVQDAGGLPFGADAPRSLERLVEALAKAGRGEGAVPEARKSPDLGKAGAFAISPSVAIDNDASTDATVIEASGRDRPGLLEALARTLSEADLSIQSAHIDGYGERAVDAFYVVTADGAKLTDSRRGASIRARLTDVLIAAEGPSARRLPKARASEAR